MIIAFACKTAKACNLIKECTPTHYQFHDIVSWLNPCSKVTEIHHSDKSFDGVRLVYLRRILEQSFGDLVITGIYSEEEARYIQSKGGLVYAVEHAIKSMNVPEINLHSLTIAQSTLKHLYNTIEKRSNEQYCQQQQPETGNVDGPTILQDQSGCSGIVWSGEDGIDHESNEERI